MSRYSILLDEPKKPAAKPADSPAAAKPKADHTDASRQSTPRQRPEALSRSANQSTNRSDNQSVSQPTGQSTNKIVDRPKAFYITTRLDRKLDQAVEYFKEKHGIRKVDRSVVVNALLDNEAVWSEESLDRMVSRVIDQLTSRLTS